MNLPESKTQMIPPQIRRRVLEAALRAADDVLADTPFRDLDRLGRLELLDVLGELAWTRYLDECEAKAHEAAGHLPEPIN